MGRWSRWPPAAGRVPRVSTAPTSVYPDTLKGHAMRKFGKIQSNFWHHEKIHGLSDEAKLLACYLMTCEHSNALGCFRVPVGFICEDLKWDREKVEATVKELTSPPQSDLFGNPSGTVSEPFLYLFSGGWILIPKWLKHNRVENPNQGRAVVAIIEEDLPNNPELMSFVFNELEENPRNLDETLLKRLRNRFETVRQPFRNNTNTNTNNISPPVGPPPEEIEDQTDNNNPVETNPEPEKSKRGSRIPDDWMPTDEDVAFAASKGLDEPTIANVAIEFRNYWSSKAGKDAIKIRWDRTWQSWILKHLEFHGTKPYAQSTPSEAPVRTSAPTDKEVTDAFFDLRRYLSGKPSTIRDEADRDRKIALLSRHRAKTGSDQWWDSRFEKFIE